MTCYPPTKFERNRPDRSGDLKVTFSRHVNTCARAEAARFRRADCFCLKGYSMRAKFERNRSTRSGDTEKGCARAHVLSFRSEEAFGAS